MSDFISRRTLLTRAAIGGLGIPLSGCWATEQPQTSVAGEASLVIENVRVVVGDGHVRDVACVVVKGDRIQGVVDTPPKGQVDKRIDGRGKTVLPGLIDTHVHIFGGSLTGNRGHGEKAFRKELADELPERLKEYLRHGVTTVKSTGDPLTLILELRGLLKTGRLMGPRLLVVGPGFTAPDGHPAATLLQADPWWRSEHSVEVDCPDKAREQVRRCAARGVDAIKLVYHGGPHPEFFPDGTKMEKLRRDVMQAIIDEAHQQGLRATVHTWHEQDAIEALQAGADGLEHGVGHALLTDDRLAEILLSSKAFYVPTLRVLRLAKTPKTLPIAKQNLKSLSAKGSRIALGTDSIADHKDTPPGLNTIKEMELMAEAGLTPERVIRASTRDAAEHLGRLDDLGTVEAGKLADLIVVDGDPLKDISAIERVTIVVQAGCIVYQSGAK